MLIDLTRHIAPGMAMYPGSPGPALAPLGPFQRLGWRETVLTLSSHTGTHMDAPAHLLAKGAFLDTLPLSRFSGRAVCLDVSGLGPGGTVTAALLQCREAALVRADFALFYTGGDRRRDGFPAPDQAAAEYLAARGLKGVGTDALSIDPLDSAGLPAHRSLLGGGLVVIEGLELKDVAGREDFFFLALPLKFEHADGAPVRAVAEL